jgi:hypothetical protein
MDATCSLTGCTGLEYKISFENSVFSSLMSAQGAINVATDYFKDVSVFEFLWPDMHWRVD